MDSVTEAAQEGMGEALTAAFSVDVEKVRGHLDQVVRASVEQTLNALLDAEAERVCQAGRYERSPERQDTRAGSYERKLQTKAGEVTPEMAKLTGLRPGTAVAVANVDAHVTVPATGITGPGKMLMIMGTSTCHMVVDEQERGIVLWRWCVIFALLFLALEVLFLRLWKV